MAKVTVPNVSRAKMAAARSGERTLPPIKMIAFGDGGVDENGAVQTPSPTMTKLNHELLRKPVESVEKVGQLGYKYGDTIPEGGLDGKSVSEVALIDEEGDLASIEMFKPKADDLDSTYYVLDDFS